MQFELISPDNKISSRNRRRKREAKRPFSHVVSMSCSAHTVGEAARLAREWLEETYTRDQVRRKPHSFKVIRRNARKENTKGKTRQTYSQRRNRYSKHHHNGTVQCLTYHIAFPQDPFRLCSSEREMQHAKMIGHAALVSWRLV